MSYILDALRKAERERGTTQVPNLMTVHDSPSAPRSRGWIFMGALAVCAAAIIWYFVPALKSPAPHPASAVANRVAQESPAPVAVDNSASGARIPSGTSKNKPAVPERRAVKAPALSPAARSKPIEIGDISPPPNGSTSSKPGSGGDTRTDNGPHIVGSGVKPPQTPLANPTTPAAVAPPTAATPPTSPAKPASFSEAMAMMNLSLLLYSDAPAERIVFINGRKYGEGDRIDGKYFIESITLEGAVLSYQGERAILRPRQK